MTKKKACKKMCREETTHRKLGDDRNEEAVKHRKDVQNFSQSRDVRDDRGTRQSRVVRKNGARRGA